MLVWRIWLSTFLSTDLEQLEHQYTLAYMLKIFSYIQKPELFSSLNAFTFIFQWLDQVIALTLILFSTIKSAYPVRIFVALDEISHFNFSKRSYCVFAHLSQMSLNGNTLAILDLWGKERKQVTKKNWCWYHRVSQTDCLSSSAVNSAMERGSSPFLAVFIDI